jgi:Bacterial extracellular solute-binding protein
MKRAITRRATRAAAAVLFAAAALVLAACSGPPAPSSGSSSSGGVVTINWQTMWSGQALQVVNQLASQFNATHPDIHVVTSNIPSATGDEKLLSESAAGDAPDVFTQWNLVIGAWASTGAIEAMNPYLTGSDSGHLVRRNLTSWDPAELAEAAQLVAEYKQIREVVQRGRLYRLASARRDGPGASQYVLGSEVVVLAWWGPDRCGPGLPRLRLVRVG